MKTVNLIKKTEITGSECYYIYVKDEDGEKCVAVISDKDEAYAKYNKIITNLKAGGQKEETLETFKL